MYRRIFPTRFFRFTAVILGAITAMWWISVLLVSIFQCTPVAFAYDKTIIATNPHAHCINTDQFYNGNAIPNIITDVLILALPVREVLRLQIHRPQKTAILGMFMMGGLVVIVSIVRLVQLFKLDLTGPNVTSKYLIFRIPWFLKGPNIN